MKIERLLAIVTYLLNRDIVRGKDLADKFEVSERTIQRDIESINMAGIPIVSLRGSQGGYQILDTYRLSKQTTTHKDLEALRAALMTLDSAIHNDDVKETLEKVNSLRKTDHDSISSLDFGVAKENKRVLVNFKQLEEAMKKNLLVAYDYTNANNECRLHQVHPVKLQYKWYAWYLIAYHPVKESYRIYKLSRMTNLKITNQDVPLQHDKSIDYFASSLNADIRKNTLVRLKCKKSNYVSFTEYFHKASIMSEDEEYYELQVSVVEDERWWFALFLSFGNAISIVKPDHIKNRILDHARHIIENYEKPST